MKAVICPVCLGDGKKADKKGKEVECNACKGDGYILVPEDYPIIDEPYRPTPRKRYPFIPYNPYDPWHRYNPWRHQLWCIQR